MNQTLELSFLDQITQTFSESVNLSLQTKLTAEQAVLKRAECGTLLLQAIATLTKTKIVPWLDENFDKKGIFSCRTAYRMMSLARQHQLYSRENPNGEMSFFEWLSRRRLIADNFRQMELLPDSSRKSGSQIAHDRSDRWLVALSKSWGVLSEVFEKKPLKEWEGIHRVVLKEQLRPMAELYESL